MNCSSTYLFHGAQSFRKGALHRPTAPTRKSAPAWAPLYRLQFLIEACSSMGSPRAVASFRASQGCRVGISSDMVLHGLQVLCASPQSSPRAAGESAPVTGAPLPSSFSDLAVCRAVSHCPLSSTLFPQLLSFYFSKILLKRQNQNKITLKNKGSSVENEFCIIVLYVFSDVKQQFLQVGQLMFKNRHSIFLGWTVTRDNESFLLN